jgi:RNA-splicing ligase RtcB
MIELTGEYTTARVMVEDASLVDDNCLDQIRTLIDHPAFTEPVRVMPDAHYGAGSPVGFVMPLGERVVPNVVGVDVGCGMCATNLGPAVPLADDPAARERRVREVVPMGRAVRDDDDAVHLLDEFPFDRANDTFERFDAAYRERFGEPIDPIEFDVDGYDGDYVEALCERVLADRRQGIGHVIRSAGTLGGGNHFVEFARARGSGDCWLVIHSGSRYLGLAVAKHWQGVATDRRTAGDIRDAIPEAYVDYLRFDPDEVSDSELYTWVTGGMGESHVDEERLRRELDGAEIERAFDALGAMRPAGDGGRAGDDGRDTDLDYLEGREGHGYLVDMLFAQQYAAWNRELMTEAICAALDVDPVDQFQSVHNYVDFRDLTIRKGATPAREGQRLLIPFNMADGSILARGKGNPDWHATAPHGAGRAMSRGAARREISMEAFAASMEGVYSESVVEAVRDEAPGAYKPAADIEAALAPTAEVVDRLDVVHNLKAHE